MKTWLNHLDLSLAKVEKIIEASRFIASKSRKNVESSRFIAIKDRRNVLRFAKSVQEI